MDFIITKIIASIFTPDLIIGNTSSLVRFIQDISNNKFGGDLTSFPLPQEAPQEIPRLIMKSSDGAWVLEISVERTNIIFIKPLNLSIQEPSIHEFAAYALGVYKSYKTHKDIRVQRIALMTERVFKVVDKLPSQYIADKFCKDEYLVKPFNNTKSFEIHSLKKYKYRDFDVNSWVRIMPANLLDDDKTPVVLVKNDINTYSNFEAPEVNFSPIDIDRFFNEMPDHLESIVSLYFDPRR